MIENLVNQFGGQLVNQAVAQIGRTPIGRLLDDNIALIFNSRRAIAHIIPDVTVTEMHEDKLLITAHPVEKGATVSDHALVMPRIVEMQVGWSDSVAGYVGAARDSYQALIKLMETREPFVVFAGKRTYQNMLVAGITVTEDQRTKHVVMATVRLQEVRIVSVQTTTGASAVSGVLGAAQKIPQSTLAPMVLGKVEGALRSVIPGVSGALSGALSKSVGIFNHFG